MKQVVLINGKRREKLSVFDRATMFGDGLFETCLVENKKIRFWSKHFFRLEEGRYKLGINKVQESLWLKDINKAISVLKNENCVVKIILSRGESSRGYGFEKDIVPTRIVIASSVPVNIPEQYSLSVCRSGYATNTILSGIKHCNRLEQILSRSGMKGDECIMLDENGYVISTSQANIFTIKDGVISTPDLENCGIDGTRRSVVLRLVDDMGFQVVVGAISMPELLEADEIFITNSIIGIRPVYMVNDHIFSQHETTLQITDAFITVQNKIKIKGNKKIKKRYIMWVVLLVVLLFSILMYNANNIEISHKVIYQLSPGSSISSVANELENFEYIYSDWYFVALAKLLNVDSSLKAGYYEVTPGMSLIEILNDFSEATVATKTITLVEGLTVQDYFEQLSSNQALVSDYGFEETMKLAGLSKPYEAKLWPDTYQVNYGDSVISVLSRANKLMQEKLESVWFDRQKNLILKDSDELLVLASLIEKETASHKEKSKIAGVFVRRLQKNMRLQTDASVVYALGGSYSGSLTKKDLGIDSPYNTYKNKGLPPAAIGSVGFESLYAAAHPDSGKSIYFVSKKDGTHAFAETYKEHQQNINKYLKNL